MPSKAKKATPAARKPPAKRVKRDRRTSQPRYAAAAALRSQILELRTLGRTIAQIGEAVNRAPSVVHGHLKHALEELDAEHQDKATKLRALAYNRLERMLARVILKAANGDLKAVREATRLIQAQARLLGFDAPLKTAATDPTGEFAAPPGTWTLPARPDASIEQWQQEAEAVWQAQRQREAEADEAG